MKALGVIAILLGLAAIGCNVYAVVETLPNYEYINGVINGSGPSTAFDIPLRESYRDALKLMAYAAFGCGILAALTGAASGIKGKFKPAWVGVALGLVGVVWQFTWAV